MSAVELRDQLVGALEDLKGQDILSLDVSELTSITDFMVIVSGTSNRHVKALVNEVVEAAKAFGQPPLGVEGRESMEWVLLDVGDVLVHVMQKEAREFYDLERLWTALDSDAAGTETEKIP
ncbi:MAG: ribosome silencing factor [Pseudomonadales bacterium]|nr:ribosome silencing factor [Pseudomonadales bacterium]